MPKEAIARKAVDQVAPLNRIPFLLLANAAAPPSSPPGKQRRV
jgi:hypothetical protein